MSDLKRTAYHEAGHAIAATELDVQFDVISIAGDEGRAGTVGVEGDDGFFVRPGTDPLSPDNERAYRAWADQQAVIDYAGHAAVVALLGAGDMGDESAAAYGAGDDFEKARARMGGDPRRIAEAKARSTEIITRRGDAVRKIADALITHTRLDAEQVDCVLVWGTPQRPWVVK